MNRKNAKNVISFSQLMGIFFVCSLFSVLILNSQAMEIMSKYSYLRSAADESFLVIFAVFSAILTTTSIYFLFRLICRFVFETKSLTHLTPKINIKNKN